MGFLDTLLGRTKPVAPNLDKLFGLPSAALTLQASIKPAPDRDRLGLLPGGRGPGVQRDRVGRHALLNMGESKTQVEVSKDSYGFTWLVCRHSPDDVEGLVTDLHAVNTSLEQGGFGPMLLCTILAFTDGAGRRLGLVYLYKRGTFYPFAPLTGERRDNTLEMQVRGALTDDLKIEADLSRWFPVWGAPGL